MKRILTTIAAIGLLVSAASAINPGTDVWTPAAARGAGSGDSFWVTDLFIFNPNQLSVSVDVFWLERDQDSSASVPLTYSIAPGATLVLEDVILNDFGRESGSGGFLVQSSNSLEIATDARIYNRVGDGAETQTFGQGFEGVPSPAALTAGGVATSNAVGGKFNSGFRTNFYGVNTSTGQTKVRVTQLNLDGNSIATADFTLPPWAPLLRNVSDLGGPQAENLTLSFEVIEGSGIFGLSTIDEATGDPTTHNMWWELGGRGSSDGIYTGSLARTPNEAQNGLSDTAHALMFSIVDNQVVAMFGEGTFVFEPGLENCGFLLPYGGDFLEGELAAPVAIASDGSFGFEFENKYRDQVSVIGAVVVQGTVSGETISGTIEFKDLDVLHSNGSSCTGSTEPQTFVVAYTSSSYCQTMPSACRLARSAGSKAQAIELTTNR